jgi:hypothetical protein
MFFFCPFATALILYVTNVMWSFKATDLDDEGLSTLLCEVESMLTMADPSPNYRMIEEATVLLGPPPPFNIASTNYIL